MPYTAKQEKFFNAVSHGMKPRSGNLSQGKAKQLASEARSLPNKPPVSSKKKSFKKPKAGDVAALREANFKSKMSGY